MKLSEAIRLGSMLGPQVFGAERTQVPLPRRRWFFGLIGPHAATTGYCALGAAAAAVGDGSVVEVLDTDAIYTSRSGAEHFVPAGTPRLVARGTVEFEQSLNLVGKCPYCVGQRTLFELIAHLNDQHRWTRECIADYVEQIENQSAERVGRSASADSDATASAAVEARRGDC